MNQLKTTSLDEVVDMVNKKTLKALGRKAIKYYTVRNDKINLYMSKPEEVRTYGNSISCIESLNQCFLLKLKKIDAQKNFLVKNIEEQKFDLVKLKDEIRKIASMRNPSFNKMDRIKTIIKKYKDVINVEPIENIEYLISEIKYYTNIDDDLYIKIKNELQNQINQKN